MVLNNRGYAASVRGKNFKGYIPRSDIPVINFSRAAHINRKTVRHLARMLVIELDIKFEVEKYE